MSLSLALLVVTACGTPEPAEPPAPEPAAAAEPAADALIVAGTIAAPADVSGVQAVFVSVRAKDGPPMPIAAVRLPPGPFPLDFELTEANRPMKTGLSVPDTFEVKVTLDVDGDPMSRTEGDRSATVTATKGARGVAIDLTE